MKRSNSQVRCDDAGMYHPLQCRRLSTETDRERPTALICYCARRDGTPVENTKRHVRSRDDFPPCSDTGKNVPIIIMYAVSL